MINETQLKRYCNEDIRKIENYEQAVNDKTQTWDCHHKLEIQGQFRNSIELLKKCGLYYHVPASQLIFLTKADHMRLHSLGNKYGLGNKFMLGRHLSEETKKKLSIANRGEKNPRFGKRGYWFGKCGEKSYWFGKHHSEETRKKMSIARKGKFCGEKSYWFGKHHSEETRKKISLSQSGENNSVFGTQWWNNGTINKRSRECPGQGWVRGRIKFLRKTK